MISFINLNSQNNMINFDEHIIKTYMAYFAIRINDEKIEFEIHHVNWMLEEYNVCILV